MKKKKLRIYDSYPIWIVIIANILFLAVYLAGAYIMFRLHWIPGVLFIIYILFIEYSVYREGCRYCCYYGRRCYCGRGIIAPLLVKKGNPKKFCERKIKFKDFIPQLLVVLVPVIVGIALLISRGFHLLTLIAVIYPVFNWFAVNPILYGKLACIHCKQGSKCCPALDFFSKKK